MKRQVWSKQNIINHIKNNSVNGVCKTTDAGMACAVSARNVFGSWNLACAAAGVDNYVKEIIRPPKTLTKEFLNDVMMYNPLTGRLVWTKHISVRTPKGFDVGHIKESKCGNEYRMVGINKKQYAVHRIIFLYMTGSFPDGDVDHIDGDGLNNAWHNLRSVTRSQNRRNSRMNSNNKSGIGGVCWHKYKHCWEVKMFRRTIGYADNIFDAACKRISAQNKAGGFTLRHGR